MSKTEQIGTRAVLMELTPSEISEALSLKAYQGQQIFQWIHRKRTFDFERMTNLSKELRASLDERCVVSHMRMSQTSSSSKSQTKKILLDLGDKECVESVLLRDRRRITLCLSSQVGCAIKCSFCATGLSGYTRNLSAGEIVGQALHLLSDEDTESQSPNIVYMGMGEPFRNYDEVVKSIRLLMHRDGLALGARRIIVSTAGDVSGIERFAGEEWQVRLSISLHAGNDTLRNELVPLNRKYNLARLKQAAYIYQSATGRQLTLEWALLKGVNDSPGDATELIDWASGLDAHTNLIPYNPVQGLAYATPDTRTCERFRDELEKRGMKATLRAERGQDIDAACGQLRRSTLAEADLP